MLCLLVVTSFHCHVQAEAIAAEAEEWDKVDKLRQEEAKTAAEAEKGVGGRPILDASRLQNV